MPNSTLPPEITSTVAAILASNAGFLNVVAVTIVPNLIRVEAAAKAASVVQHSKIGLFRSIK